MTSKTQATLLLPGQLNTLEGEATSLRRQAVLVEGRAISYVGPAGRVGRGSYSAVIELPDSTLLPGFIDAHTHLAFDGGDAPIEDCIEATDEARLEVMGRTAEDLVRAGVTSARDLGSPGYLASEIRTRIESNEIVGPNIYLSHMPITATGGHLSFLGGGVVDLAAGLQLVAELAANGADWIKVIVSGGWTTPGSSPFDDQFDQRTLKALTAEIKARGLKSAAHAHTADAIHAAIEAGFDTIEHCTWLVEGPAFATDDDLVSRLVHERKVVCPTIGPNALTSPNWPRRLVPLRLMADSGVHMIAGTDSGIPGTRHRDYGDALLAAADLGWSNLEVLRWASIETAHAIGLAQTGGISVGKTADLVAVHGDPLNDLTAVRNVPMTVVAGRVIQFQEME